MRKPLYLLALLILVCVPLRIWAQPASTAGGPPRVICRPCGEVPPPKGYSCAAGAMVDDSVPNAEIAGVVAAACKPASVTPPNSTAATSGSKPRHRKKKSRKAQPQENTKPKPVPTP